MLPLYFGMHHYCLPDPTYGFINRFISFLAVMELDSLRLASWLVPLGWLFVVLFFLVHDIERPHDSCLERVSGRLVKVADMHPPGETDVIALFEGLFSTC